MRDSHINQLEARLESLVEGAFAHFFGRKIRAQDIALQLARSMESGLRATGAEDPRPIAPDNYQIFVSQDTVQHLRQRRPNLAAVLSQHLVELATDAGYRMDSSPIIQLMVDETLKSGDIHVQASHINDGRNTTTSIMEPVAVPSQAAAPLNAQFVIGERSIPLNEPLLNVGRNTSNHVILDDPRVSRHHAQIRLRFGQYTLFDVKSRAGTFVNDVMVKEHTLVSGDIIRMGDTKILYIEDEDNEQTDRHAPVLPNSEDV